MQATLDRYAARATDRLGRSTSCSLMLRTGSTVDQVASNDPRAAACDRVEVRLGIGPCLTAIEQLSSIILDDLNLESDDRWPEWKQVARSFGFSSFLALPGYVDDTTTVALNVYRPHPGSWRRQEIISIDTYVQELAATLRTSSR